MRMLISRSRSVLVLLALVVVGVMVASTTVAVGNEGQHIERHSVLWSGVTLTQVDDVHGPSGPNEATGPVAYAVVHIEPGAQVRLKPVVSTGRVGTGREPVSSMCRRMEAVACVNASFPLCPRCEVAFGGLVRKRQLLQSPSPLQNQLQMRGGRTVTSQDWTFDAWMVGANGPPRTVGIDALNTGPEAESIVVHTPRFGSSTGAPAGSYEVILGGWSPIWVGGSVQPVRFRGVHTAGDAPIHRDGIVLSGIGRDAAHRLWRWTEANLTDTMWLAVDSPADLDDGISGHPLLLQDGQEMPMDRTDHKVVNRHPRTVIGWDGAANIWLVVIDGRVAHSQGMDLDETRDLMLSLGATHTVNLDGGGSSVLATWCNADIGWCVRNSPSDGRERVVPVGLVVVPDDRY